MSTKMEWLCGKQLESGIQNITSLCTENFTSYIDHVSETGSLKKRLRPKPLIILKKTDKEVWGLKFHDIKTTGRQNWTAPALWKRQLTGKKLCKKKKRGIPKVLTDVEKSKGMLLSTVIISNNVLIKFFRIP